MSLPKETDENIRKRFEDLMKDGESLTKNSAANTTDYTSFSTSVKSLARLLLDETRYQEILQEIQLMVTKHFAHKVHAGVLGILRGLKGDYESGMLDNLSRMIETNVSYDFMEQAEQLLVGDSHQYDHVPAAVLAGAVLEDSVRRLCQRQDPPIETEVNGDPKKLDLLISDLQKRNVINKPKAAQLRSWASIRNSAAHGRFDEFTRSDAGQMLAGIKIFLADYL